MVRAKRRKRSPVADKRKELLTAAIEIFAKKGYNKANIKELSDMAGVACGTVYLYFKNKDDLLLQAIKTMMDTNLSQIREKISNIEPSIEKLYMFFYHHIELFTHNPSMAQFLVVELKQSEEFYKKHPTYNPYHEYMDYIHELVTKAVKEGTTLPYNPKTISFIILGTMDALLTQWLVNPESVDLEETVKEIRAVLHNGMKTGD